jgi:hypothetical protein
MTWLTNLRLTLADPLRRRYIILREIVTLMGLVEYLGLGAGISSAIMENSLGIYISALILGTSYYISTKLAYRVSELMIQLQLRGTNAPVREQMRLL